MKSEKQWSVVGGDTYFRKQLNRYLYKSALINVNINIV